MDIGSLIGGIGSVVGSGINAITSASSTKKMIAAQKEMNQQNIASQERINQQNIDYQNRINDLMRLDSHNQIGIKKQDLINAGYSTANPELNGNEVASLGSPNLQASQVRSEFTPEMANIQQQGFNSFAQSLLDSSKSLAGISLMKAQARNENSKATLNEIDMLTRAAQNDADLNIKTQTFVSILKECDLKDETKKKIAQETNFLWNQSEYVAEQVLQLRVDNQFEFEKKKNEVDNLKKVGQEIDARIANINADTDIKSIERQIKGFESDIMRVKSYLAEFGINFDSGNIISTIASIVMSPNGSDVGKQTVNFCADLVRKMIGAVVERSPIVNAIKDENKRLAHGESHVSGGIPTYGD